MTHAYYIAALGGCGGPLGRAGRARVARAHPSPMARRFNTGKFCHVRAREANKCRNFIVLTVAVAVLSGCTQAHFPNIVVRMGEGGPSFGANPRSALVASDAAEADVIARQIMAEGGTAADAAIAAAFTLAVVLPSRAGIAARGACLVQDDGREGIDALDFTSADDA